MTDQQRQAGVPTSDPEPRPVLRRVHRSPRYGAFLVSGAVVGVALAVISGAIGTGDGSISAGRLIGYLAVVLGLLGALLGGAVAVLIERFSRRPSR